MVADPAARIPTGQNGPVPVAARLSDRDRAEYREQGFLRIERFVDTATCDAMLGRVTEMVRLADEGGDIGEAFVLMEGQSDLGGRPVEERVSKIFRVAREPVFAEFAARPEVLGPVRALLGTDDVSCFLSQFIFKNRGAWGQPWHQDSYYFPFEPPRPVVGVWLAVSEATLENGCLHVLPGSHAEPVHEHVPDARPGANFGYTEIVDHDTTASVPVLMEPGDLLLFDSHLMHRSTDNRSEGLRAAMVFHYAASATVDRTEEIKGYTINDWIEMPAR
jgi:ectoine hydroxylase-related dioxygenase (phytanoyl-CoA dioxygenase family)